MFRCGRLNREGGGVALFIKYCLVPNSIQSPSLHINSIEITTVTCDLLKLKLNGMICRVIALHCPYTLSAEPMRQMCSALSKFMATPNRAFSSLLRIIYRNKYWNRLEETIYSI